jgi:predicted dehydrogenase
MMTGRGAVPVALIGCGAVAELYYMPALQALTRQQRVEVKALFDPAPARRDLLQRAFPFARPVDDLSVLPELGVELAIVASPPRYHAPQSIALMQAGMAVLCEKPLAMTLDEGKAMVECARVTNRSLAVGLYRRFLPAAQFIQEVLAQRRLGEVRAFSCSEGGHFRWPVQSPAFFQPVNGRGGVLLDIGVHLLDLLLWWWGEPVVEYYADDAMGGVEANCQLRLAFSGGVRGTVRLSRDCALPNRYVIECEQGRIVWEVHEANRVQIQYHDSAFALEGQLLQADSYEKRRANTFEQSFISQLHNVLASVRGEAELRVSGAEALRSLQVIEACYAQGTLLSMPWLSDTEQRHAALLGNRRSR